MRGTQCECSNFKIIYLQRRDAVKVISCLNIPCVYSTVCRLKLDEWLASCVIKVLTRSEMCLWWSGDSTRRGFVEPVCAYCRVLIGCEHIMVLECDHWCFLPKRISTSVIGSPVVFRGHCWWTNELAVGLTWNCGFLADQIFGWKSTPSMSCHDFFYPVTVCRMGSCRHETSTCWTIPEFVRHDLSVGGQSKYDLVEWLEHSAKFILTDPQFLTCSMTSWYKPSIAAFSVETIAVEKDKSISQEYKPVVSTQIKCPQRLLPNPCCRWIWQSLLCDCKGRDHSPLDQVRRSLRIAQCFLLFWMDSRCIRWLLMGKRSELRAKTPPLEKLGMIDGVELLNRICLVPHQECMNQQSQNLGKTIIWWVKPVCSFTSNLSLGLICWFQERALLFDEPRSATVQAIVGVVSWSVTTNGFGGSFSKQCEIVRFSLRNTEMTFIRDFAAW